MTTTETIGNVSEERIEKEFGIEIDPQDLKAIFKGIEKIADEIKVNLSPKGIEIRAVDPAHVTIRQITIDESAFQFLIVEGVDNIGLSMDDIKGVLKLAKKGDIIRLDLIGGKISYTVGIQKGTISLVDTNGMSDPKLPNLELKSGFKIGVKDISDFLSRANDVSDYIKIEGTGGKVKFIAEGESNKAEMEIPGLEGPDFHSGYSLDYMEDIIKAVKGVSKEISVKLGSDYPIKIEWEGCQGKGKFVALLAPRLENGGR
jgi:proliferating cell nuclear antigen